VGALEDIQETAGMVQQEGPEREMLVLVAVGEAQVIAALPFQAVEEVLGFLGKVVVVPQGVHPGVVEAEVLVGKQALAQQAEPRQSHLHFMAEVLRQMLALAVAARSASSGRARRASSPQPTRGICKNCGNWAIGKLSKWPMANRK